MLPSQAKPIYFIYLILPSILPAIKNVIPFTCIGLNAVIYGVLQKYIRPP